MAILISLGAITACIFYLVLNGISLRTAPLIQPSIIEADQKNVADALSHRLFQEFQNSHYVIWGVLPETSQSRSLLERLAEDYQKIFKATPNVVDNAEFADAETLRNCSKPCWLKVNPAAAHRLEANSEFDKRIIQFERPYFSLTLVSFTGDEAVSEICENQKRLSFNCLVPVSVRSVKRKFREPAKKYFFLNKYYENSYFLFLQNL